MKRTDQILAMARIDPRLTTDRRVDLREKSRRDLDEVEAAPYARRRKAGKIADHTSTERNERSFLSRRAAMIASQTFSNIA